MKLGNLKTLNFFLATVNECGGAVWLESPEGDRYNLKSKLSQYVAMGALLGEHGDDLLLFCSRPEDELKFIRLFRNHPEMFG